MHRRVAFVALEHHVNYAGAIFGHCWQKWRVGWVASRQPVHGMAKPYRHEGDKEHSAPDLALELKEYL